MIDCKMNLKKLLLKLNFQKKYLSCKWLEHGIIFDHNNLLRVCCSQSHEGQGRYILKHNYTGEEIDWKDIFAQKRIQREMHRKGKIFPSCKGCSQLEYKSWDKKDYIDTLLLTHWIFCNSKCTYCPAITDEELIKTNKHYSVVPALKDMIDKKILKKDSFVSIAGGESTIYPEFEEMLHLLLDYGMNNILLSTSAVKYSDAVEKGLKEGKLQILVSLDAGTKETHKKIKLIDSFDITVENLKKYNAAQNKKYNNVFTKYIIIPGINDNKEEIDAWLNLNKEIGLSHIFIDVEIDWHHKHFGNIPEEIKNLILYIENKSEKMGFSRSLYERAFMIKNELKDK